MGKREWREQGMKVEEREERGQQRREGRGERGVGREGWGEK